MGADSHNFSERIFKNVLSSNIDFHVLNIISSKKNFYIKDFAIGFGDIYHISKMIPTAPFTPVGVNMSQCPIRIIDCRLNSRVPLFHWSLTPTGVKGAVRIIFDI